FFESSETAIMHIRASKLDVAQRRHGEFGFVALFGGDQRAAKIFEIRIEPVIGKALTLEKRPTMAMKTIGAELLTPGIVFGVKQFKTALLFSGELRSASHHEVEFRTKGSLRQKKLFGRTGNPVSSDLSRAECTSKECGVAASTAANLRD